MTMTDVRSTTSVPTTWASAGIVDARIFTVGDSTTIHTLTHASPMLVRGRCGITAHVVERDGRLAEWAAGYDVDQPRCARCES